MEPQTVVLMLASFFIGLAVGELLMARRVERVPHVIVLTQPEDDDTLDRLAFTAEEFDAMLQSTDGRNA